MTNEFRTLFSELKEYLRLEQRFVLLSVAEKTTVIISMLVIIGVLMVLGSILIAFLLMGLANHIGSLIGSVALGYVSVAAIAALLMGLFWTLRATLVINPLASFMASLFDSTSEEVSHDS